MRNPGVFRQLYIAALILFALVAIGIIGFMLIEHFEFLEAFYMTIITLSTVGFSEVHPLSSSGKLFTATLIICSFGTFAYGISVISRSIITGELGQYLKLYRLESTIETLENHVIICGYGRNGRRAARKLQAYGKKFVILENNEKIIDKYLMGRKDMLFMKGDATTDEALLEAGVERASSLISTLSIDADNLFVVISARSLNKNLKVISRASSESTEKKLKTVGVDNVVMPEGVGGAHMATLVVSPNIVEFLEFISVEGSSAINLEEIEVRQLTQSLSGVKLKDLELRQKTGCTIIGLRSPEGEYVINPGGEMVLTLNSQLFVLGKPEEIKKLNKLLRE